MHLVSTASGLVRTTPSVVARQQAMVGHARHFIATLKAEYDIAGDLDAIRDQAVFFTTRLIRRGAVVPASP